MQNAPLVTDWETGCTGVSMGNDCGRAGAYYFRSNREGRFDKAESSFSK